MSLSIRKIEAIFKLKMNLMLRNMTIMVTPLMAIFFVILMKQLMPEHDSPDAPSSISVFVVSFGLLFNSVMGGIFMGCIPLAEEKEKHTLRVLMTSSVNGSEFFIGSTLPALIIILLVNVILLPIASISFSQVNLLLYFSICLATALISLAIGYITAMLTKTQSAAQLISVPFCLFFTLFPFFSYLNETIAKLSQYVYSGIIIKFINKEVDQGGYHVNWKDSSVLLIWLTVAILLFIYTYKKNGLDND